MARARIFGGALLIAGTLAPIPVLAQEGPNPVTASDQPSTFVAFALPPSTFAPMPLSSSFAAVEEQSSFGVTEEASSFGAVEEPSTFVTEEPVSILTELGATRQGDLLLLTLPGDVLFDFDQSYIRDDARPVLARLAEALLALPGARVEIIGHTDAKGDDDYNLALSQRRAEAVRDWLAILGLSATGITTAGAGESTPVAPNAGPDGGDNPEGRQKNRRVEFVIRPG